MTKRYKNRFEIFTIILLLIGILLLTLRFLPQPATSPTTVPETGAPGGQPGPTFGDYVRDRLNTLRTAANQAVQAVSDYLASLSLWEIIGWLLILASTALLVLQRRNRFLQSIMWVSDTCPVCNSKIHRTHRTKQDHWLGSILRSRLRRYTCSNADCRWSGLRYASPNQQRQVRTSNPSQ